MCERAVEDNPCTLEFVPDKCKMKEMCERAVGDYPWALEFVPDHLKTKEMCDKAVKKCPCPQLFCDARANKNMA